MTEPATPAGIAWRAALERRAEMLRAHAQYAHKEEQRDAARALADLDAIEAAAKAQEERHD